MKTIAFALSAVATAFTVLALAGPSAADQNEFGTCPDGYTPTPALFVPPDEDKNGDGVICVKTVDDHQNIKDDPNGKKYDCNGFPTPPPECAGADSLLIRDDLV
jgi:hypothetical protein